jgi:hypothetical protein
MTLDVRHATWPWRSVLVALALAGSVRGAAAQSDTVPSTLRPARLFSDGLVLQRGKQVPIWGWAPAKTSVSVSLNGQTQTATADATGVARHVPRNEAGGPYEMTIAGGSTRLPCVTFLGESGSRRDSRTWRARRVLGQRRGGDRERERLEDPRVCDSAFLLREARGGGRRELGPRGLTACRPLLRRRVFSRAIPKSIDVPVGIIHVVGRREHRDVDEPRGTRRVRYRSRPRWRKTGR